MCLHGDLLFSKELPAGIQDIEGAPKDSPLHHVEIRGGFLPDDAPHLGILHNIRSATDYIRTQDVILRDGEHIADDKGPGFAVNRGKVVIHAVAVPLL